MAYTQLSGTFLVRRSVSSGLIESKNTSTKAFRIADLLEESNTKDYMHK